jgi:hypothetical protein
MFPETYIIQVGAHYLTPTCIARYRERVFKIEDW